MKVEYSRVTTPRYPSLFGVQTNEFSKLDCMLELWACISTPDPRRILQREACCSPVADDELLRNTWPEMHLIKLAMFNCCSTLPLLLLLLLLLLPLLLLLLLPQLLHLTQFLPLLIYYQLSAKFYLSNFLSERCFSIKCRPRECVFTLLRCTI